MAVREKALRVDEDVAVAAGRGDRLDALGSLALQRAARSNDCNAHG
jgi:hypothetical protein